MKTRAVKNRIILAAVCVLFIISLALCAVFCHAYADHRHADGLLHADCVICQQLTECGEKLHISDGKTSCAETAIPYATVIFLAAGIGITERAVSLISLKVKLTN